MREDGFENGCVNVYRYMVVTGTAASCNYTCTCDEGSVQSLRIYRRANLHESLSWVGFGLFAAVLVYLIAGIANDSNVCTAPVFWGMLGLGLATNRMLVEKEKLFVKDVVTTVGDEGQTETLAVEPNEKVMKEDEAVAVKPKQTSNKKQSRKQRKNQKK